MKYLKRFFENVDNIDEIIQICEELLYPLSDDGIITKIQISNEYKLNNIKVFIYNKIDPEGIFINFITDIDIVDGYMDDIQNMIDYMYMNNYTIFDTKLENERSGVYDKDLEKTTFNNLNEFNEIVSKYNKYYRSISGIVFYFHKNKTII